MLDSYFVITQSYCLRSSSFPQYGQAFPSIRDRLEPQPLQVNTDGEQIFCVLQSADFSSSSFATSFRSWILPFTKPNKTISTEHLIFCMPFSTMKESPQFHSKRSSKSIFTISSNLPIRCDRSSPAKALSLQNTLYQNIRIIAIEYARKANMNFLYETTPAKPRFTGADFYSFIRLSISPRTSKSCLRKLSRMRHIWG